MNNNTNDADVRHNIMIMNQILNEVDLGLAVRQQIKNAIKGQQDLLELRQAARNLINAEMGMDEEEFQKLNDLIENTLYSSGIGDYDNNLKELDAPQA